MVTSDTKWIKIKSRNAFIWNKAEIYAEISQSISAGHDIILDFGTEGIDLQSIGFFDWLDKIVDRHDYDPSKISIHLSNMLSRHEVYQIHRQPPMCLMTAAKIYQPVLTKSTILKPLGCFIGRSNAPRLLIASYIWKHFRDQVLLTFHYDPLDTWHQGPIGLEEIINDFDIQEIGRVAEFLLACPLRFDADYADLNSELRPNQGHDHRLLTRDQDKFISAYQNFFAEIVCESFYSGKTFFPTEKLWRPMLLMTPFIIHGPANYIENLRKLGFRTFHHWWDEGYSLDPPHCQIQAIIRIVHDLCSLTADELRSMYDSMHDVLIHNRQRFLEMTKDDWKCFE